MINPNNEKELTNAIKNILTNNKLRQNLIKNGLERAKTFTTINTAKNTLKHILSVWTIIFKKHIIKTILMSLWRSIKGGFERFSEFVKPFTDKVNLVVNTVLLSIVYFIGVGFTSVSAKLVGKKFLKLEKENTNSYWIDKEQNNSKESYFRQF